MLLDMVQGEAGLTRLKQRLQAQGGGFSFYDPTDKRVQYIIATEQSKIVGLLGFMEKSDFDPDYLEFVFCEVHAAHRRQGVAAGLVEEFMTMVAARDVPVTITPYEEDGVVGLQPLIQRYAAQHSIPVLEQGFARDIGWGPDFG